MLPPLPAADSTNTSSGALQRLVAAAEDDPLTDRGGNVLADVVELDRKLAVAAVHEADHLDRPRTTEVHQRVHGGADRAARADHVVDEDHDPVVDGRRHLGQAQRRPLAARREIVAVERGVEDADGQLEAGDLAQVRRELSRQGHAPVGDRDEVEAAEVLVALEDLVGDPHERAADGGVVEDDSGRNFGAALADASAERMHGGRGRCHAGSLSPPRGTELKGLRVGRKVPGPRTGVKRGRSARTSAGTPFEAGRLDASVDRIADPVPAHAMLEQIPPGERVQQLEPALPFEVPRPVEERRPGRLHLGLRGPCPRRGCPSSSRGCRPS